MFNFIHCDFPYGINADGFDQGSAAEMGGYEDSTLLTTTSSPRSNWPAAIV